ncbi:MAG TPA: transposase [Acetobacteraceae bacterium]|nr:transposase [Acetobacteraceae bacterium]
MPRKRYSDDVRHQVMMEVEHGAKVEDVLKRHGIAEATFYRWRARYKQVGDEADPARRLLEEENRQLRDICAEAALEIRGLKQELARLQRTKTSP